VRTKRLGINNFKWKWSNICRPIYWGPFSHWSDILADHYFPTGPTYPPTIIFPLVQHTHRPLFSHWSDILADLYFPTGLTYPPTIIFPLVQHTHRPLFSHWSHIPTDHYFLTGLAYSPRYILPSKSKGETVSPGVLNKCSFKL
jgi:hypothetical protein